MNIQIRPDVIERLAALGDTASDEPVGDAPLDEKPPESARRGETLAGLRRCISYVTTPQGKKPVFKAVVSTACEKNCHYCAFRAGRTQMRREVFTPDELARVFDELQRARIADGIFLSSGILHGGVTVQDKIIDTIEIIRRKYHYRGYIHLKIMPGAERDQIIRAMQLADRVSVNLEAPTPQRLAVLAPKKDFNNELFQRLTWASQLRREWQQNGQRAPSLVTQFVVGAVGDTDLELLSLSAQLYRQMGLKRAYYSRFHPVSDTPLENLTPTPALREFRLYQSSFLLRDYNWDVEDLPFAGDGNLPLDVDPKRAWADLRLLAAPIEINLADRPTLLRIPGIGPVGADAILKARRLGQLRSLNDLRKIGIHAPEQAAPYILLDGQHPPRQLQLF